MSEKSNLKLDFDLEPSYIKSIKMQKPLYKFLGTVTCLVAITLIYLNLTYIRYTNPFLSDFLVGLPICLLASGIGVLLIYNEDYELPRLFALAKRRIEVTEEDMENCKKAWQFMRRWALPCLYVFPFIFSLIDVALCSYLPKGVPRAAIGALLGFLYLPTLLILSAIISKIAEEKYRVSKITDAAFEEYKHLKNILKEKRK